MGSFSPPLEQSGLSAAEITWVKLWRGLTALEQTSLVEIVTAIINRRPPDLTNAPQSVLCALRESGIGRIN